VKTLGAQPWWTAADEAELDLLVHDFVKAAFRHREACAICSAGGPWCGPLREAFEAVRSTGATAASSARRRPGCG
jgi:hypothetical protein